MITTSVMIQLGRVKGNKMVNMQLSNRKLVDRGTRMIIEELGLEYDKAKALLLMHGIKPDNRTTLTHNTIEHGKQNQLFSSLNKRGERCEVFTHYLFNIAL